MSISDRAERPAPRTSQFDRPFEADLPEDWESRPAWTETVQFNIKRMRTTDVIGAGTTVEITDPSRNVREGLSPGTWDAPSALRRATTSWTARSSSARTTRTLVASTARPPRTGSSAWTTTACGATG